MDVTLDQDTPAAELVTVERAKVHLEYTPADKDGLIADWIVAAREQLEEATGRAFVNRACVATWHSFPPYPGEEGRTCPPALRHAIRLPVWPVPAVASVRYYDAAGVQQTLTAGTDYLTHLPHLPALVYPAPGKVWPVLQAGRLGGVEVAFTAGYGDAAAAAPRQAAQAVLLTLDYWFKNRGGDDDPSDPTELGLPAGAVRIFRHLRRSEVG